MQTKNILKFVVKTIIALIILDAGFIWVISRTDTSNAGADAAIILGAAINTPAIYNRTMTGLQLYLDDKVDTLVLAGGQGPTHKKSEAQNMKEIIEKNTDKKPNLVLEDKSHNTIENIKNSRAKIPEAESVIVVSDKFHLARAFLIAKRNGFETVYWTGPEPDYYRKKELAYYYFREAAALIIDLRAIVKN